MGPAQEAGYMRVTFTRMVWIMRLTPVG